MRLVLDHSIVGQSATSLTIRKDREFAGCRICGDVFQSSLVHGPNSSSPVVVAQIAVETREWRNRHNRKHTEREHEAFVRSGRTFSPHAAHRLAPFGLVPLLDAMDDEVAHALKSAPRAPLDDAEGSVRGLTFIQGL